MNAVPGEELWRAVLVRAIADALIPVHEDDGEDYSLSWLRARARFWFRDGGKDYEDVCRMSGIDAEGLRSHVLTRIEHESETSVVH